MGAVRIAQISDLHFGASFQDATWAILRNHLQTEIQANRIHLVLVTGDIVNTPRAKLFEAARRELDSLDANYLVCAGNHDRHPLGNSWRVLRVINWATRRTANFSQYFEGKIPTLENFIDEDLINGNDRWKVRVAGVDSSLKADISARGYVELGHNEKLVLPLQNADDVDLAILLIHHHLMPIRALEAKHAARGLKLSGLTSLTALVNAGTVLESLAQVHFDIALHGHEHASNWGRYGTLQAGGSEVVVLSAGSATGTITLAPCDSRRMSYNLITLWPNRSVEVFVLDHDGNGGWTARERLEIMNGESSRRQRFLRRSKDAAHATDMVKVIEFARNGDGLVNQYQTDWRPEHNENSTALWSLTAINSTGARPDLSVRFIAPDSTFIDLKPIFVPGAEDHTWRVSEDLADNEFFKEHPDDTFRLEESYRWKDGGILTAKRMDELLRERKSTLGMFRRDGREFGAISDSTVVYDSDVGHQVPSRLGP